MTWDLTARPMEEGDLAACASMFKGRLAYPDRLIAELPRTWLRLLRDDAMNASVFEDRNESEPGDILGFGVSVFVTDAWVEAAKNSSEPYLTAHTVHRELHGPASPILRPEDIARQPDSSLSILILHYCETPTLEPDLARMVRYLAMQDFLASNRGYRINEVIQEVWDEIDPAFLLNGWGKVRTDYESYFTDRGEPVPPAGRRPYLIGFTREEALDKPGDLTAPLFTFIPPRFSFSPAEKKLIRQALSGRTDLELARALHVAVPTVKSHWRSIYDRVVRVDPELLSDVQRSEAEPRPTRGKEKRRQLLEYIRRHPEELCPVDCGRHG
jgi:hypothetical protein